MSFQPITFPAANKSLESIPARSFVRVDSGQNVDINGSPFRVVNGYKPDGTAGEYWVTGDGLVPQADNSQCVLYVPVSPVWVRFASDPEGDACGPVNDEWTASDSGSGFKLLYYDAVSRCGLIIRANGSGSPTIQFRITASYFCGSCYVSARVVGIPDGASVGDLPGIDVYDNNAVEIYDKSGCFFDEPEEDLLNRLGYAVYQNCLEDGPCPNTAGKRWVVISLCCKENTCI